jgi:hypothetical protein
MNEDDFEPWLGKTRARSSKLNKRYAHRVLAAINRAGGRHKGKGRFTGRRIGRGGAIAAVLAGRDKFAAFRQRRVVVKARIVRLAGKGMDGAKAHIRYIQREGVTCEGERGELYNAEHDRIDGKDFLDKAKHDRHQFRFIVAPEDAVEYGDLKPLTRRLMEQMEEDLGTRLDWVSWSPASNGRRGNSLRSAARSFSESTR